MNKTIPSLRSLRIKYGTKILHHAHQNLNNRIIIKSVKDDSKVLHPTTYCPPQVISFILNVHALDTKASSNRNYAPFWRFR